MRTGRLLSACLLALLCVSGLLAAEPQDQTHQPKRADRAKTRRREHILPRVKWRSPEVEALTYTARTAPAEFAADALIRLAESSAITERAWKRELLEEAFRLAANAQQPVRRRYIGGNVDTRQGYLSYAFDLKLDTLSLRARAVKVMLAIDPRKARELLGEVTGPELLPLSCRDALVYDVGDFYEALAKVAQTAFSPGERARGEHVEFVLPYIDRMSAPAQIGPLGELIRWLELTPPQLEHLVYTFSRALASVSADDRSFDYFLRLDRRGARQLDQLVEDCKQRGVAPDNLLAALRTFLVRHLRAERCADSRPVNHELTAGLIEHFNQEVRGPGGPQHSEVAPIEAGEIIPLKVGGAAERFDYWQTPKAKDLLTKVKQLRFGAGKEPLSAARRRASQWQRELTDFLHDLAAWRADDEASEADYVHQKSVLLGALVALVPHGATRDRVLEDSIAFLRNSPLRDGSRAEWFMHVQDLVRWMRTPEGEPDPKFWRALGESKDAVLELYAAVEKIAPRPKAAGRRN